MSDPRTALRAAYGRWLCVRARVRALSSSLVAAEHALRRDAREWADRDMRTLVAQLASEREAFEALGRDLDARIAEVKRDCYEIDVQHVEAIANAARRRSHR